MKINTSESSPRTPATGTTVARPHTGPNLWRTLRDTFVLGLAAFGGATARASGSGPALADAFMPSPREIAHDLNLTASTPAWGRRLQWWPHHLPQPLPDPPVGSLSRNAVNLMPHNGVDGVYSLYKDDATAYFFSNDPNFCRHLRDGQRMQKHRFGVLYMGPRIYEEPGKGVVEGPPLHDMSALLIEMDTACQMHSYTRWYNRTVVYNYQGNLGDFISQLSPEETIRMEPWMWVGMKVTQCEGFVPQERNDDTLDEPNEPGRHWPRTHLYKIHDEKSCVPAPNVKVKIISNPLY